MTWRYEPYSRNGFDGSYGCLRDDEGRVVACSVPREVGERLAALVNAAQQDVATATKSA